MNSKRVFLVAVALFAVLLAGFGLFIWLSPAKPEPTLVYIDISGAPVQGSTTARFVIVEFGDFQCPYCGDHAKQVLPKLYRDYVAKGKLLYAFLNFPLPIHEDAPMAAAAAACAGDQGKFWEMHHRLFDTGRIAMDQLYIHATDLGLDTPRFRQCLDHGDVHISDDYAQGMRAHVSGTPTFFLGRIVGHMVMATAVFRGAVSYRSFEAAIDEIVNNDRRMPTGVQPSQHGFQ